MPLSKVSSSSSINKGREEGSSLSSGNNCRAAEGNCESSHAATAENAAPAGSSAQPNLAMAQLLVEFCGGTIPESGSTQEGTRVDGKAQEEFLMRAKSDAQQASAFAFAPAQAQIDGNKRKRDYDDQDESSVKIKTSRIHDDNDDGKYDDAEVNAVASLHQPTNEAVQEQIRGCPPEADVCFGVEGMTHPGTSQWWLDVEEAQARFDTFSDMVLAYILAKDKGREYWVRNPAGSGCWRKATFKEIRYQTAQRFRHERRRAKHHREVEKNASPTIAQQDPQVAVEAVAPTPSLLSSLLFGQQQAPLGHGTALTSQDVLGMLSRLSASASSSHHHHHHHHQSPAAAAMGVVMGQQLPAVQTLGSSGASLHPGIAGVPRELLEALWSSAGIVTGRPSEQQQDLRHLSDQELRFLSEQAGIVLPFSVAASAEMLKNAAAAPDVEIVKEVKTRDTNNPISSQLQHHQPQGIRQTTTASSQDGVGGNEERKGVASSNQTNTESTNEHQNRTTSPASIDVCFGTLGTKHPGTKQWWADVAEARARFLSFSNEVVAFVRARDNGRRYWTICRDNLYTEHQKLPPVAIWIEATTKQIRDQTFQRFRHQTRKANQTSKQPKQQQLQLQQQQNQEQKLQQQRQIKLLNTEKSAAGLKKDCPGSDHGRMQHLQDSSSLYNSMGHQASSDSRSPVPMGVLSRADAAAAANAMNSPGRGSGGGMAHASLLSSSDGGLPQQPPSWVEVASQLRHFQQRIVQLETILKDVYRERDEMNAKMKEKDRKLEEDQRTKQSLRAFIRELLTDKASGNNSNDKVLNASQMNLEQHQEIAKNIWQADHAINGPYSSANNDDESKEEATMQDDEKAGIATSVARMTEGRSPAVGDDNMVRSAQAPFLLTVFQSGPLVSTDLRSNRLQPVPGVNFELEISILRKALACDGSTESRIGVDIETATVDRLDSYLSKVNSRVMHFSCFGHPDCLIVEDKFGGSQPLYAGDLKQSPAIAAKHLQLVFVFASRPQGAAKTFLEAGVPHVVCCRRDGPSDDPRAFKFARTFYQHLIGKKHLKEAFEMAQNDATADRAPDRDSISDGEPQQPESEKFVLLPERPEDDSYHDVPVTFGGGGSVGDPTPPNVRSSVDRPQTIALPKPPSFFVGRELDMHKILTTLATVTTVRVVGPGGIGKSSLVAAICQYLERRKKSFLFDDIIWLPPFGILHNSLHDLYMEMVRSTSDDEESKNRFQHGWYRSHWYRQILDRIKREFCNKRILLVLDATSLASRRATLDIVEHMVRDLFHVADMKVILIGSSVGRKDDSLGGRVEKEITVGSIDFESTALLFGRLSRHVTEGRNPVVRSAVDFGNLLSPPSGPKSEEIDMVVSQRRRVLFELLGHGNPANIIARAAQMTDKEFDDLVSIAKRPEYRVNSRVSLENEIRQKSLDMETAISNQSYLQAQYLEEVLVELTSLRLRFPCRRM